MIRSAVVIAMTALALTSTAASAARPPHAGPPDCVPPPHCSPAPSSTRLEVPAQALSHDPTWSATPEARGLRIGPGGRATLTVRRPAGFDADRLTVTLVHEVLSDEAGTIGFSVTPIGFAHGNAFETYGAKGSELIDAPETLTILFEHTIELFEGDVDGGYGWPFDADWWYFGFGRLGSYPGDVRLMAVSIDW